MRRYFTKLLSVQSIVFLYIIGYCIATFINPNGSSARYIATVFGNYDIALDVITVAGLSAFVGLIVAKNALQNWFYCLPFVIYAGLAIYGIILTPYAEKSITGIVNFLFVILLLASLTWEKVNE